MVDDDGFDVAEGTQRGCDFSDFRRVASFQRLEQTVEQSLGLIGLSSNDDFVKSFHGDGLAGGRGGEGDGGG